MATWLRQSTSVDVPVGPFLDSTDGVTAETALTITQPDIRLKKNGGAWAQKNAAQTLAHEENGWYEVTLDATDTNTLGILVLSIQESGALPVWREFLVVPANVWDSYFSTDLLQVDVTQIAGAAVSTSVAQIGVQVNSIDTGVVTANALATDAVDEIAEGILKYDLSVIAGEASRSLLNAIRFLRNKWSVSGSTLTVTKENDTTTAWTATLSTTAGADPVTGSDPA